MRIPVLLCALAANLAAQEVRNGDDLATAIETLHQRAAQKADACVVAIRVEREAEDPKKPATTPPRRNPFGLPGGPDLFSKRPPNAWCTGTIVEAGGTIVTTHFNVSGKLKSILVRLPDGRELEGKLLASNADYDLAAIKIDAASLPTLAPAPLKSLKSGNAVLALGRAPDGKGLTLNPGIVSSPTGLAGRAIQTDAKLNFGNVGGPLVDAQGRLVAITCKVDVKYSDNRGQNSGVGFAITHDRLAEVLTDLKAGKSVAESGRTFLGILGKPGSDAEGVELDRVVAGSPAEKAGARPGDVIVEFDGSKISGFEQLKAAILRRRPGDKVAFKVTRGDEEHAFECELAWDPGE